MEAFDKYKNQLALSDSSFGIKPLDKARGFGKFPPACRNILEHLPPDCEACELKIPGVARLVGYTKTIRNSSGQIIGKKAIFDWYFPLGCHNSNVLPNQTYPAGRLL